VLVVVVILAPKVYKNAVVVKTLVVGFQDREDCVRHDGVYWSTCPYFNFLTGYSPLLLIKWRLVWRTSVSSGAGSVSWAALVSIPGLLRVVASAPFGVWLWLPGWLPAQAGIPVLSL